MQPTAQPTASFLEQFKAVSGQDASTHLNMLVYGASGVGKTILGATGPGPILYLDLDDGLNSVRAATSQLTTDLGIDTGQIRAQRIYNYADLKKTLLTLTRLKNNDGFFSTICLDNLTVMQAICMQQRTDGDESVSIDRLPQQQDWGILLQRMRAIVRVIRDLPCHTLFIAMEQERNGFIGPALQGAIFREIPAMVDVVCRYVLLNTTTDDGKGNQVEKEVRRLQCHPSAAVPGRTNAVIAKNRGGRLAKWETPHLRAIIDKVFGTAPAPEG